MLLFSAKPEGGKNVKAEKCQRITYNCFRGLELLGVDTVGDWIGLRALGCGR